MILPYSTEKKTYAQVNKWTAKTSWLAFSRAGFENLDLSDSTQGLLSMDQIWTTTNFCK